VSRKNHVNPLYEFHIDIVIYFIYFFWKSIFMNLLGRAIAEAVSRRLPTAAARARARSGHVGFVVDKGALGQVFSKYLVSPANHSTNFSIIIITRGWHNRPAGGRSAEWTQLDTTPTIQIKRN
jgi:hypothetical protein